MTRYAKAQHGTHRKPQEATPWSELKPYKVSDKSKNVKKKSQTTESGETPGADYRRGTKNTRKKRKRQWQKTEWEMITTGEQETRGLAADLLKIDKDAKNPTLYRPQKIEEKKKTVNKSLADRLRSIQEEHGAEFNKKQRTDVAEALKKDDRREDRRLKRVEERSNAKTCFNCREVGHDMTNCPKLKNDVTHGTGICFKCGSTEHAINDCSVRLPAGIFPYAKCFLCGETGHLSKQCPDNPRGLYPNGGCCRGCGSVEHYNKDCPETLKKQGLDGVAVSRITWNTNTELDEGLIEKPAPETQTKKRKPKVVKF